MSVRSGLARLAAAAATVAVLTSGTPVPPVAAQALSPVNGTGSSYVGLAMQQWTAEAQTQGLRVNYTPNNSPDGLNRFKGQTVDFAGTEAEFASLAVGGDVSRGYQYVPDVGGAVAVMYNVEDLSGRKVDYLHLSRRTIAKIFIGEISRWSDPAIAADNTPANLRLPDEPINVIYRSGQSGTTALFYDFVREMEPQLYAQWASRNRLPNGRIIELDSAPSFAPKTQALSGSDQIAQFVAGGQGKWSIAYDEFGYAKTYNATSAWVDNQSGEWTLPYAENISAALEAARLRPDLSQELSGVYTSTNPLTYPISAYSYLVTQCEQAGDRPTCRGPYSNPGVTGTLARWMRYIACDGQVRMAALGYSPLPSNLSQEIANSVARMTGESPERLSSGNCANPRFRGSLGAGASSPPDPYDQIPGGGGGPGGPNGPGGGDGDGGPGGGGGGGGGNGAGGGGSGGAGAGGGAGGGAGATGGDGADGASGGDGAGAEDGLDEEVAAGRAGADQAVGGGSGIWQNPAPAAYGRGPAPPSSWPWIAAVAVLAVPTILASLLRRLRLRRARP